MLEGSANITAESSVRNEVSVQSGHFSCSISSLIAGQTRMARYPAKHNRLPCLLEVGQLTTISFTIGWSCEEILRLCKALSESVQMRWHCQGWRWKNRRAQYNAQSSAVNMLLKLYEAYSESKYRLQIFPLQRCGCRFAHVH
jgi:hypothetical protein